MIAIRFNYTNWREEDHEYVVEPESVSRGKGEHWYLHATIVTRDGNPRPEIDGNRRRSFELARLEDIEEVEIP